MNLKPAAVNELNHPKLYGQMAKQAEMEPRSSMVPRCPKRLSPAERKIWKNIAAVLKSYGLFAAANAIQMEMLSTVMAQYLIASDDLKNKTKGNLFIADGKGKGGFKENPILRTQQRLRGEISTLCAALGLSSMGMARIGLASAKKKKEANGFFEE